MAIYQIKSSLVDSTSVLQLGKRHCRFFHKRDRRLYGAAPPPFQLVIDTLLLLYWSIVRDCIRLRNWKLYTHHPGDGWRNNSVYVYVWKDFSMIGKVGTEWTPKGGDNIVCSDRVRCEMHMSNEARRRALIRKREELLLLPSPPIVSSSSSDEKCSPIEKKRVRWWFGSSSRTPPPTQDGAQLNFPLFPSIERDSYAMEKAQMSRMNRRTYISPENTHTHISQGLQLVCKRLAYGCEAHARVASPQQQRGLYSCTWKKRETAAD